MNGESVTSSKILSTSTFRIRYEEAENAVVIEDNLKQQTRATRIILLLTLLNSLLNVSFATTTNHWRLDYVIWGILGIVCIASLAYSYYKKTSEGKFLIPEILCLKERILLGRSTYSLKLSNGRSRNLLHLKKQSEITELKSFFENLGIRECRP